MNPIPFASHRKIQRTKQPASEPSTRLHNYIVKLNTLALSIYCQYADDVSVHLISLNIELIPVIKQAWDITSYIRQDLKNSSVPYTLHKQNFLGQVLSEKCNVKVASLSETNWL